MDKKINMGNVSTPFQEPLKVWCDNCFGKGHMFVNFICDPETERCPTCLGTGRKDNPRIKK